MHPATLRLPHFVYNYSKYWLQGRPGDSSKMCKCGPWRQSLVTVFCSRDCPSDRLSRDIKIQYINLLVKMHTCLDFAQLSGEICYSTYFFIESLINFIFKCCYGNCSRAAQKTVWKVNCSLRFQLRALATTNFLLPGSSAKPTHTGNRGHSQFGKVKAEFLWIEWVTITLFCHLFLLL